MLIAALITCPNSTDSTGLEIKNKPGHHRSAV